MITSSRLLRLLVIVVFSSSHSCNFFCGAADDSTNVPNDVTNDPQTDPSDPGGSNGAAIPASAPPVDDKTSKTTTPPTALSTRVPTRKPTAGSPIQTTGAPVTKTPTTKPTPVPSPEPTAAPTITPTEAPTSEPSPIPSSRPSAHPSPSPTSSPTPSPTVPRPEILSTTTPNHPTREEMTDAPSMEDPSSVKVVVGSVRFTILVKNGTLDSIPFSSYEPQVTAAVDSLAVQVLDDLEKSLLTRRWLKQQKLHRRIATTAYLQQEDLHGQERRHLQEDHLELKLPSTVNRVQNLGFTANPDVSSLGVFLGGDCPNTSGNNETDRCEELEATIELYVDNSDIQQDDVDPFMEQVQTSFQLGLVADLARGKLQYFLQKSYPRSHVSILSGQVSDDKDLMDSAGDFGGSASPPISAFLIIGIALSISLVLALIVCLVSRKRRQKLRNVGADSKSVTFEQASPKEMETTPAASRMIRGIYLDGLANIRRGQHGSSCHSNDGLSSGDRCIRITAQEEYAQPHTNHSLASNTGYVTEGEDDMSMGADASRAGSVHSGIYTASSLDSRSTAYPMSGSRMVDWNVDGKSLLDDIRGGEEFDNLEDATLASDWVGELSGAVSRNGSTYSGVYTSASVVSRSTVDIMSGNRVVDWNGDEKSLRDCMLGVDEFDALEAAIMTGDWVGLVATASTLENHEHRRQNSSPPSETPSGIFTKTDDTNQGLSNRNKSWEDVIDSSKALAQLDQHIQKGDWAAVVETTVVYSNDEGKDESKVADDTSRGEYRE